MVRSISLLIMFALAAGASAQINHPHNEFGLYAVPDPDGCESAQIDVSAGSTFTAYLVLTSPWNEQLDRPVATIGGLEFRFVVPDGIMVMGIMFPPFSEVWPVQDGNAIEYYFGTRAPVTGGSILLGTCEFLVETAEPDFFYLQPITTAPPSIPGSMAFTDYDDAYSLQPMDPVSGSPDVPVFAVNWDGELSFCETVPDQGMAFGAVKALYR